MSSVLRKVGIGGPSRRGHRVRRQAGSSLIEVMVSVLLLSIGISGGLSLLSMVVKEQRALQYKVIATQSATALMERMRANRLGVQNASYLMPAATTYATAKDATQAASLPTDSAINSCAGTPGNCTSAAHLADFDIATVRVNLRAALPDAALVVTGDTIPNAGLIVVAWTEPVLNSKATASGMTPTVLTADTSGCPTAVAVGIDWTVNNVRCMQFPFRL